MSANKNHRGRLADGWHKGCANHQHDNVKNRGGSKRFAQLSSRVGQLVIDQMTSPLVYDAVGLIIGDITNLAIALNEPSAPVDDQKRCIIDRQRHPTVELEESFQANLKYMEER